MNFGFTEEQDLLRSEVRKLLDERCPIGEVRRLAATPAGFSTELWRELAELGWLGLLVPEAHGGASLGWVDLLVVLEEAGRTLFPSPLLATTLAASTIADSGNPAQQARWLPSLADGSRVGTVALLEDLELPSPEGVALKASRDGDAWLLSGAKRFVPDVGSASLFVVAFRAEGSSGTTLAVLDAGAPGVKAMNLPTMDATKRLGSLILEHARVDASDVLGTVGGADASLTRLFDRGALAVAAESLGAAEAAHALTVQYAKDRGQFGNPIGRYQGVKHPLAEMYVALESARSLVYFAAWALDESPDEVPRAVSLAKAATSEAFARIGIDGVQLHGAVGYTAEYDIQLYLKRSKWARVAFGDPDFHYERIAALGGL